MSEKNFPSRADVERIIEEEAKASGILAVDIIHCRKSPTAVDARRRAIWRIVHETGCSASGLGSLWGLDTVVVTDALRRGITPETPRTPLAPKPVKPKPPRIYDDTTVARLIWQHGPERTAKIVAGEDDATNLDLARWRLLCAGAER